MADLHVSLPEDLLDWMEQQVIAGRYVDVGDYIAHLVRESKTFCENRTKMQAEIEYGLQSHNVDLTIDDVWRIAKERSSNGGGYGQR